jgi:hypothetical protein
MFRIYPMLTTNRVLVRAITVAWDSTKAEAKVLVPSRRGLRAEAVAEKARNWLSRRDDFHSLQ